MKTKLLVLLAVTGLGVYFYKKVNSTEPEKNFSNKFNEEDCHIFI